ncbi:MAG: hypothetical protein LBL41_02475 [Bifidobacteriaceae bacterium]|jgi:DNA polymerase-3 subunit delta|nr:hypothetical protein [Bifidobacteriaceae bacterium]
MQLFLIKSDEYVLRTRALNELKAKLLATAKDMEFEVLSGVNYAKGTLIQLLSPSLFQDAKCCIVETKEETEESLFLDVTNLAKKVAETPAYLAESVLIVTHYGRKGIAMCNALKKANATVITAQAPKKPKEVREFIMQEFKRNKLRIARDAIDILFETFTNEAELHKDSFSEFAALSEQMAFDANGAEITSEFVQNYLQGTYGTSNFDIANLALDGNVTSSLLKLRVALQAGEEVPKILGAISLNFRRMAQVSAGKMESMHPFVVRVTQDRLRFWSPDKLSIASEIVADTYENAVTGTDISTYGIEKAIIKLAVLARRK